MKRNISHDGRLVLLDYDSFNLTHPRIAIAMVLQSHVDTDFTEHFLVSFHSGSLIFCDDIIVLALLLEI